MIRPREWLACRPALDDPEAMCRWVEKIQGDAARAALIDAMRMLRNRRADNERGERR